ncbi:MAG: hypothetical protein QMD50_03520 [Patescibacteria group bacterium]|nr:hypothetical protein [Patescibacteria group bacterium]
MTIEDLKFLCQIAARNQEIFNIIKIITPEKQREKSFKEYWELLSEEGKRSFIKNITPDNTSGSGDTGKSYYEDVFPVLNTFSSELKEELVDYLSFGYGSIYRIDPHIYWVPKEKRLEYLKERTPLNNILCYALFDKKNGLLKRVGTENEILSFDEIKALVSFFVNKYGRLDVYVSEAIKSFEDQTKTKVLFEKDKKKCPERGSKMEQVNYAIGGFSGHPHVRPGRWVYKCGNCKYEEPCMGREVMK